MEQQREISNLSNAHLALRLKSLEDLSSLFGSADVKPLVVKRVTREILHCLIFSQFQEKRWSASLWQYFQRLLLHPFPVDLESFIVEILSERIPTTSNPTQLLKALQILLSVLNSDSARQLPDWVPQALNFVGLIIEKIATCEAAGSVLTKSTHEVLLFLQRSSLFVETCANLWSSHSIPAVALVLSHPSLSSHTHADQLLRTSLQSILNGSLKQPSIGILQTLAHFLSTVTQCEWDESYSPALTRLIKKSPETSAPVISVICSSVRVDLSVFVESSFLAPAVKMLKSSQSSTREAALGAISSITQKCSAVSPLLTLLTTLVDALSGKVPGSGLTLEYQKIAVLDAISKCVSVLNRYDLSSSSTIIDQSILSLLICVEKEADDNIKFLEASVASSLVKSSVSSVILDAVASGIGKKKSPTTTSAFILYLARLFESSDDVVQFCSSLLGHATLLSTLGSIVKDAIKKTGVYLDAVLAFGILSEIHSHLLLPASILDFNRMMTFFGNFASENFLWNSSLRQYLYINQTSSNGLQLLSSLGVISLAKSICGLNRTRRQESSGPKSLSPGEIDALLFCAHFPCRFVFNQVKPWIVEILGTVDNASSDLLSGLISTILDASSDRERKESDVKKNYKSLSTEESAMIPRDQLHFAYVPPSRFRDAISLFLTETTNPCVIAQVILLAAHPYLSPSYSRSLTNLKFFLGHLNVSIEIVNEKITSDETLGNYLSQLLSSHSTASEHCFLGVLLLLFYTTGSQDFAVSQLSSMISSCLKTDELSTFTEEDISVFLDPTLLITKVSKALTVDDIKITNADRKKSSARGSRRGQFGADFIEDEAWAEQVKREKAKKLQEAKVENSPEIEEAKAKTADIISKVNSANISSMKAIRCLNLLAQSCIGNIGHPHHTLLARTCHVIIPQLMLLIPYPLLKDEVNRCLDRVVFSLVDDEMKRFAQLISNSLRVMGSLVNQSKVKLLGEDRIFSEILEFSGPIVKTVTELHVLASRPNYLISSKSFHVLFPLFRGLFTLKGLIPGCEYAFLVLDKFWSDVEADKASRPLLRYFIETCLVVLSRFRVSPPADRVLIRIISATTLTPMEWSPLLGPNGLLNAESSIRKTCLLGILESLNRGLSPGIGRNPLMVSRMWVLCHDSEEEVKQLAVKVWQESQMSLSEAFLTSLCPLLHFQESHVALSAARAIAGGILTYSHLDRDCMETLVQIFLESLPETDHTPSQSASLMKASLPIRLPVKKVEDTKVSVRVAIAAAFEAMGSLKAFDKEATSSEERLKYLLAFLLEHGVTDNEAIVREAMVTAGRVLLDNYGDAYCESILHVLENTLNQELRSDEEVSHFDYRHEAAVVLLGAAGKHLQRDDPHLINILESLVKALSTPVASIQRSVADCLVSIVQVLKTDERMNEYLGALINKALNSETYGERRGAAFGVSAFVKGLGIPSIKNHDIVNRLKDECSSGSISSRQGSLFIFELLSERLGMLFEPYVITIMPVLLKCFSHSSDHVREAAQAAAKTIMAKLSAHGVKQVLTPILSSLPAETAWKSKQEALKLLGTMAFCAPKQLATSLPQIIPGIIEASLDGHPKVKESAKIALVDISSVIRNPEVSSLSGILIGALTEPANKTKAALEALLECEFMHSIDAPSLAILIPILARALKDRGGDLKRKSAIILGNMCSMINDAKIFIPYLPQVVPGLQEVLLDPIPDVRATSAKALGSLMGGVGEIELPELVPWLIRTLKTESSPVERSGAAQGLAEICLSLPEARIEQIIRDSMTLRSHSSHSAREGLLWLLTFLPSVLGEPFSAYISATLPVVLSGLSDDSEGVREVALRAGQVYVTSHGRAHTRDVLHPLLSGMFDDDWRIRESSVTLLGELLYLVGDTKAVGMTDLDNDDDDQGGGSSSRVTSTIRAHIGEDLADFVLSSLYIVRSDNSSSVRQIALQVWKSIVSNTPKTLREIMPSLVDLLIRKLSSQSNDQQVVAGRSLGDLVKKLGDHVLPLVIPYLQRGLQSDEAELRQGVCLGLAEILRAASQKQIETYVDTLVPALQEALCDDSEHVRSLASQAFHALMKAIGGHAIETVVPILLTQISENFDESNPNKEISALRGLRSIVNLKPRDLLEYLLPILTKHPIQPASSHILGVVCQSASASIHYHFSTLIPLLIQELVQVAGDESNRSSFISLRASVALIVGSTSSSGLNFLVSELGKQIEHENNVLCRMWGCLITADFFRNCSADYSEYIPVLLKYLLSRSADLEVEVLEGVLESMIALTSVVSVESLASHMDFIRSCLSLTASDAKHRPGRTDLFSSDGTVLLPLFRLPKALEPFLPIYIHCLMNGAPETREVAADGIGELISMTDPAQLKPYLIKTTGPLIRVVGDRYPSSVKYAILQTLCILLDKGGLGLKAFVPQLQTTFVKSLSDPAKQVRTKGASALGLLMPMSTRIDPLLNELCQGSQQAESHAIRASLLQAICSVLDAGGEKASESSTDRISQVVLNCLTADDEQVRSAAAEVASSLGALLPSAGVCDLLFEILALDSSSVGWAPVAGKTVGCGALLRTAGDRSLDARSEVLRFLESGLNDDRAAIKGAACSALSLVVTPPTQTRVSAAEHKELAKEIINIFLSPLAMFSRGDYSLETRRSAVGALKDICKHHPDIMSSHAAKMANTLCPIISNNDSNIRLKRHAERAMKYLLGISYHSSLTDQHYLSCLQVIQSSNAENARFLRDYAKRMLSKLSEESDDNW